ncbi:MAG TPA: efflux transporter outer membrane subunit [Tepidisphaeraceae bacterium]|jgi:NodT family efflux transporter outer membrane factor (OMF) lipoprotein|nr:efflux transporter outer membrane subunit [Tepidisphaeraceae bacterium]
MPINFASADNRSRRKWIGHASVLGVSLIAGCAVGPNYRSPSTAVPDSFDGAVDLASTVASTQPSSAASPGPVKVKLGVWWQALGDPQLDSLVHRAVVANYDIRSALARLQEAREVEYAVGGGVLEGFGATPGVDVSAGAGRGSGTDSARGRVAPPVYAGTNTNGLTEITHVAGFDAGWEIDLFGRYTRLIQAAHADAQAAAEYRNDVLITVVADVVRSYIDVRSLQLRLEIARENAASQTRTANLVRVRFQRGLTNELDVALAERQLARTLSTLAPLQAAVVVAERRVAILLALYPEALRGELETSAPLPRMPPEVGPGMPVALLRRRPDIRRAERQLAAATARVGVATANLFPSIALTAGAGVQGQGLGRTPVSNSLAWSVGPTLYWPFLDFGQLDAAVKVADYQTQEALFNYKKLIITAVQDVNNALSNYSAQQDSLAQLDNAVASSRKAVHLATRRYENGLTDFLNVLDAQRQLFDLEDQYAVSQQNLIYQFVALYKSLGGGWQGYEKTPAAPRPLPAILAVGTETIGNQNAKPAPDKNENAP